ncbi:MAG: hypothetical protein ACHQAY_04065 [Hyphomicrobiales bacterium]
MRVSIPLAVAAMIIQAAAIADAQTPAKKAPAESVAYFTFSSGLMGELPVDGILKETRQGGKVTTAILDVCHSVSEESDRKDRFVATLKPQGAKLVGTAESQEDKLPVSVSLIRKQTGSSFTFEGSITRGSAVLEVSSADNTDESEEEFRQSQPEPETLVAAPKDFTEVAPDTIVAKIKRPSLAETIKGLRNQDALVDFTTLAADCSVLRSGEHIVKIELDPERAPALIAALKSAPGVTAAGFGVGTYSMDRAIRFAGTDWRSADGRIDKAKIEAAIGAAAMRAFSGKLRSSQWEATSGGLTLKLDRPDNSIAGLDLAQIMEVTALIGPEKPGSTENLVLWVGDVTAETVDEGAGPRLKFSGASVGGAGEDQPQSKDGDALVTALAQALKGRTWDSDQSAWK